MNSEPRPGLKEIAMLQDIESTYRPILELMAKFPN